MIISLEISYYPLADDFNKPISDFIEAIQDKDIEMQSGAMSTLISGEYDIVMSLLTDAMKNVMEKYPSVFNIKLSNTCQVQ